MIHSLKPHLQLCTTGEQTLQRKLHLSGFCHGKYACTPVLQQYDTSLSPAGTGQCGKGYCQYCLTQPVRWCPNHCHPEQHGLTYWCQPMCKMCLRLSFDTIQLCGRCRLNCHPNPKPTVLWCNLFGNVRITVTQNNRTWHVVINPDGKCLRLSSDTTQSWRRHQNNCHPNPEPIVLWHNWFGDVRIIVTQSNRTWRIVINQDGKSAQDCPLI